MHKKCYSIINSNITTIPYETSNNKVFVSDTAYTNNAISTDGFIQNYYSSFNRVLDIRDFGVLTQSTNGDEKNISRDAIAANL